MPTRANSSSFETFTESHYSQTKDPPALPFIMFETFTESHYSQTISCNPYEPEDIHRIHSCLANIVLKN